MGYADKLKDPRWQKKRLEILEAAKWQCEECQSKTDTLHVHHLYYEFGKDPWDYPDMAYRVLCDEHHKYQHIIKQLLDEQLAMEFRSQKDLDALMEVCGAISEEMIGPVQMHMVRDAIHLISRWNMLEPMSNFFRDWELMKEQKCNTAPKK